MGSPTPPSPPAPSSFSPYCKDHPMCAHLHPVGGICCPKDATKPLACCNKTVSLSTAFLAGPKCTSDAPYCWDTKVQQGGQRQLRHSKVLCGHDLLRWRRQPVQ